MTHTDTFPYTSLAHDYIDAQYNFDLVVGHPNTSLDELAQDSHRTIAARIRREYSETIHESEVRISYLDQQITHKEAVLTEQLRTAETLPPLLNHTSNLPETTPQERHFRKINIGFYIVLIAALAIFELISMNGYITRSHTFWNAETGAVDLVSQAIVSLIGLFPILIGALGYKASEKPLMSDRLLLISIIIWASLVTTTFLQLGTDNAAELLLDSPDISPFVVLLFENLLPVVQITLCWGIVHDLYARLYDEVYRVKFKNSMSNPAFELIQSQLEKTQSELAQLHQQLIEPRARLAEVEHLIAETEQLNRTSLHLQKMQLIMRYFQQPHTLSDNGE